MIHKSKAIVLHQVKYAETSLIVTLYTESSGRQAYIINGIRSSKSKPKMALFQPLSLLEIDAYVHPGREINRLKEFRLLESYQTIPLNVVKSSIALFLAEMLNKVLRSEESDVHLFEFLTSSLLYFDSLPEGYSNFHLWFLLQLSAYLGFKPSNNYDVSTPWFSLKQGRFASLRPFEPVSPDKEQSQSIARLMSISPDQLNNLKLDGASRSALLSMLVEYYAIHFEGIGKINSLDVLTEVFR
jgi:DNA repair protein RecO (recombination protein O)